MRSGVVVIDEIDAHLHPEWQREIGFWLKLADASVQYAKHPLAEGRGRPGGKLTILEQNQAKQLQLFAVTNEEP